MANVLDGTDAWTSFFFLPRELISLLLCFFFFFLKKKKKAWAQIGRSDSVGEYGENEVERKDGRESKRGNFTLGSRKMNHIPIFLEHVDFLNGLNRLHIKLLKRRLQLLIIRA